MFLTAGQKFSRYNVCGILKCVFISLFLAERVTIFYGIQSWPILEYRWLIRERLAQN
jgi:hypothetical protein